MIGIDAVRVASYLAKDHRFVTVKTENETATLVMCSGVPIPQRMFFAFLFEYSTWAHLPIDSWCDKELETLWKEYKVAIGDHAPMAFARKTVRAIIAKFVSRKPTFLENKQIMLDFCLDFQESEAAPILVDDMPEHLAPCVAV
jgi:hypothetical protein